LFYNFGQEERGVRRVKMALKLTIFGKEVEENKIAGKNEFFSREIHPRWVE
jgi:hypothetical protein